MQPQHAAARLLTKHVCRAACVHARSGLFYLRSNTRTLDLLTRLEDRLSKTKYWDQSAYNEEIFTLSHGDHKSPQVTVRVMEIDVFMNSKRLFKIVRHMPKDKQPPKPVTVHINYHPGALEQRVHVWRRTASSGLGQSTPARATHPTTRVHVCRAAACAPQTSTSA